MANGNGSESSPLWYSVGALILVVAMMAAILAIKPLEFKPVAACEGEACAHEGAPAEGKPEGVSHAAPPAGEHAPEGASHEAAPAPHA